MDKQLKQLKTEYENELPIAFTEQDKQAVFDKIKKVDRKQKANVFPFYPKTLAGVLIAAAVLFIVITVNNQPGLFMGSSDDATDSAGSNEMSRLSEDREMNTMEKFGIAEEESVDESQDMDIAMDTINLTFDPESVLIGSTFGNLEATEVNRQEDHTTVVFHGEMRLSGAFEYEGERLMFVPRESSIPDIPMAIGDSATEVSFQIENEGVVRTEYGITDQQSLKDSDQDYLIEVSRMVYQYTPNGSIVDLEVVTE